MTITFFSNFFNHHQKPVCDEFAKIKEVQFKFVSTTEMPESFKKSGYIVPEVKYEIKTYLNNAQKNIALQLIEDSDVIIFGAVDPKLFNSRINQNKLTFKYSERIFKSNKNWINPHSLFNLIRFNTLNSNKNFYLLCAGGYVVNDFSKIGAFKSRTLKWGYFTKTNYLNIDEICSKKSKKTLNLLFVGRLIPYKQPELTIELANILNKKNIPFFINIVGTGLLLNKMKKRVSELKLNKFFCFKENLSNNHVLELMQKSDALLCLSNKEEGWGAVANEAMANGCPLIIANTVGAAPFLIKNNWNGLVFNSKKINDLEQQVLKIYESIELKNRLIKNAYHTISNEWSPQNAAANFTHFCQQKLNDSARKNIKSHGEPMSKANKISYQWHQ